MKKREMRRNNMEKWAGKRERQKSTGAVRGIRLLLAGTMLTGTVLTGCGGAPGSGSASQETWAEPGAAAATTAGNEWKSSTTNWDTGGWEGEAAAADEEVSLDGASSENGQAAYAREYKYFAGDDTKSSGGVRGPEEFNTEEYRYIDENGFKRVMDEPLSTFSVDVDTASYGNIRRMLRDGSYIPRDAVRIEEMLNYFDYDYPEPEGDVPFSVTTEYSDCPWNENSRLLLIGLQAKEIDFSERPASNLVFLLDVSGSMYSDDKLPLVQKSFTMLTENLDERDRVSIVTYAGYESVVLDGVSGTQKAKIAAALSDLEAGGSTAGAAGIEKAYALAEKNFIPGGNNRVLLATDGDLNVGISSEGALTRLIQKKRQTGVHLSVLGVGTGNIKDNKMEALADNGNGNYHYLDSIYEAKKVLVDEMGGTLVTVAKDVKIQVEFNPAQVAGYRLVGYENRLLEAEDFDNDKIDAGEIGSGHSVTALYEILPAGGMDGGRTLKYQTAGETTGSSELLTVNIRYKAPNGDKSRLLDYPVESAVYREEMSENLMFAAAVAEFGMVLRDSEHKGNADFSQVMELAESCVHRDTDDYKKEFLELVGLAKEQYP